MVPPILIPRDFSSSPYTANATLLIDTSSDDLESLQNEIRNADVIWLVYSDHFTYERISLYWMVMFRSMGVNLPVVLCSNKADLEEKDQASGGGDEATMSVITDEFISLLNEFKEIESAIRCSAKRNYNVNQCFYLCQRAVLHPLSPLFDSQKNELKPDLIDVLSRIFFLCDKDQDGCLNNKELLALQKKCFGKNLDINELDKIKKRLNTTRQGLTENDFINLNKYFVEHGRHETTWSILRAFHYTDSLSLDPDFLYPRLDVPENSSVELSPVGYRFLVDLFILFDKDNDGGLNELELTNLFKPTPGIPKIWDDSNFPHSTVRNEQGYVTLQGWLAQWSMSTLLDYKVTLEYFAYLGFEFNLGYLQSVRASYSRKIGGRGGSGGGGYNSTSTNSRSSYGSENSKGSGNGNESDRSRSSLSSNSSSYYTSNNHAPVNTISALKVTKPRKTRRINSKIYRTAVTNRTVFNCFVLGSPGCGKTSLLDTFLQRTYNEIYIPTIHPRTVVNSVELKGGKQHYLILEELGQLEPAILANSTRLQQCDVICLVYDSSNPDSFQYLVELRNAYPQLDELPLVYVALKADLDKQQQRSALQPEHYTKQIQVNAPLHVSCNWPSSVLELFLQLADAAQNPSLYTPNIRDELQGDDLDNVKNFVLAATTIGVMSVITTWIWKMSFSSHQR